MTDEDKTSPPNIGDDTVDGAHEPSERELIEAAAAAAPVTNSTTTQRAANIIEAAAIQREAISESFEKQKKAIQDAVREQRVASMEQMNMAQRQYASREMPQSIANEAIQGQRDTSDSPPQQPQSTTQTNGQAMQNMHAQQAPGPQQLPAADPVAEELAKTIRTIIAEEIDAQLKALLAAQTQQQAPPQNSDE